MSNIERERPEDTDAIRNLLAAAFPTPAEAALVDDLRAADALLVSLVAFDGLEAPQRLMIRNGRDAAPRCPL